MEPLKDQLKQGIVSGIGCVVLTVLLGLMFYTCAHPSGPSAPITGSGRAGQSQ